MRTSHSKCNAKKNRLQKRVSRLQAEQDELRAKLLKYQRDLEEKEKCIKDITSDYEQIISGLELELRKSTPPLKPLQALYNKSFDFRHKILNWTMYGVYFAVIPTIMKLSISYILGYSFNYADLLPDFLLILFSISGNLRSMMMDDVNKPRFKLKVNLFLTIIILTSLTFSICLSIPLKFMFVDRILKQPVVIMVLLSLLYLLIMIIIVIGFIVIIREERETRRSVW